MSPHYTPRIRVAGKGFITACNDVALPEETTPFPEDVRCEDCRQSKVFLQNMTPEAVMARASIRDVWL